MDINEPYISVLIPIYKAEHYLHKCIDSILNQTFQNFEIILVNDGSPDRSGAICDDYSLKDRRVKVIHQKNGGVGSARQAGLDLAIGTYIIYIDPDDWLEPNMLEDMYNLAQKESSDIIISDYYIDYGSYVKLFRNSLKDLNYQEVLNNLILHSCAFMWNKLIRRSCYYNPVEIKWDIGVNYFEDMIACVRLLHSPRKVSYLPKAYYHYTQNVNPNALIQKTKKFYQHRVALNERVLPLLDEHLFFYAIAYLRKLEAYAALNEAVFDKKEFLEKYGELMNVDNCWHGEKKLRMALNGYYHSIRIYLKIDNFVRANSKRVLFFITNILKN